VVTGDLRQSGILAVAVSSRPNVVAVVETIKADGQLLLMLGQADQEEHQEPTTEETRLKVIFAKFRQVRRPFPINLTMKTSYTYFKFSKSGQKKF
jgi:hypothetical protein